MEESIKGFPSLDFAVVANQVKQVSRRISEITTGLNKDLAGSLSTLTQLGDSMIRVHIARHEPRPAARLWCGAWPRAPRRERD